ncbi:MAG: SpoIIE family protein phosphatase [Coriobacteriales bacterium]|nr:SpoIIE family protein phosphatase [Coriobacteriales bacterium]
MPKTDRPRSSGPFKRPVSWLFGSGSTSIATKLLRAFLIVSVLGMLAVIIATEVLFQNIFRVTEQSNLSIGETAAQSSNEALTSTVLSDMERLAQTKADVINESIGRLSGDLTTLANYANDLYAHPQTYREVPFEHLRGVPADTLALQWALSPGMVAQSQFDVSDLEEAGVREETFLLGNIEYISRALMVDEPNIASIYITTQSGINIGFDSFAEQKWYVDTIDLRQRDWYVGARENKGLYLSDTYRDSFDRGLNITMSMPLIDADGSFRAVIGADINISDLDHSVEEIVAGEGGYAVLLGKGEIISAPALNEDNQGDLTLFLGSASADIIEQMGAEPSGSAETNVKKENAGEGNADAQGYYAVWAPVEATGWQLVILIPQLDITAPSIELHSEISTMTGNAAASASNNITLANMILIGIAVLLVVASILISRLISRRITHPITKLSADIEEVASGELDYHSDITTGDEIEALSHSFENMTSRLKDYIAELNQATAERERANTELSVAAHIQASMLPSNFPAFPDRDEFDITASMDAAKGVGGDFYDFFFCDERHLVVVIADVSGKGVPAALFMVVARTIIKNNAQMGLAPSEVFTIVNDLLFEGNDSSMFVTAFMGSLDLTSGVFTYVNAGHNPALVSRAGGSFEELPMDSGFVLGALPGFAFEERQTTLGCGDRIFLYTDGVTEANSPALELFTERRLLEVLNERNGSGGLHSEGSSGSRSESGGSSCNEGGRGSCSESGRGSVSELLARVKRAIVEFAAGAEQADDITMLALEFRQRMEAGTEESCDDGATGGGGAVRGDGAAGGGGDAGDDGAGGGAPSSRGVAESEIRIRAHVEQLPVMLDFIDTALEGRGFTTSEIRKINIVAEEVFVNIAHYAYGSEPTPENEVAVTVRIDADGPLIHLSFKDCGIPFNPLEHPEPNITLDAEERQMGGLGIYTVRAMMDELTYVYEDGHNILTLKFAAKDHQS